MDEYSTTSYRVSRLVTNCYSTSFSIATSFFKREKRDAICSIYGFVRLADEIVDTFHDQDKEFLLEKFEKDFYDGMDRNISLNPVLQSFLLTVKKYNIPDEHIQSFLRSMKFDLIKNHYSTKNESDEYIYGSADVVGLMCLRIFCSGDEKLYYELEQPAMKLGSAFQKVNFLRDLKNDMETLDRSYFPAIQEKTFDEDTKDIVIKDIEEDFRAALRGIKNLPDEARLPVYIAYTYYNTLLNKIKNTPAAEIMETRIRISDSKKMFLLVKAIIYNKLGLI